jgi:hypothetical protein
LKLVSTGNGVVEVELTRRNLIALLQKLDSAETTTTERTLVRRGLDGYTILHVKAVPDDEHYSNREPGPMRNPRTGEIW